MSPTDPTNAAHRRESLTLIRDGTIFVGHNTEIDFRTPDYKVWLTIKGNDTKAEAVAAALEAAFGDDDG